MIVLFHEHVLLLSTNNFIFLLMAEKQILTQRTNLIGWQKSGFPPSFFMPCECDIPFRTPVRIYF